MIAAFAATARADGQIPVAMLIQARNPGDADLLAIARPALERNRVPYFATAEHFNPRDRSGFRSDGHYRPDIDLRFGASFAELLDKLAPGRGRGE